VFVPTTGLLFSHQGKCSSSGMGEKCL
jgi:hypothetical protein